MAHTWKTSLGEEVANSVSHGLMAVMTVALMPYVAVTGYIYDSTVGAAAKSVFMVSMLAMFLASSLYHSMAIDSAHKRVFRVLDHIFIFVAIAGSYTPICVLVIGGWLGWGAAAFQWLLVALGAVYQSLPAGRHGKASLTFYLLMGWAALILMPALFRMASAGLLAAILAGGLFYSAGAAIYALKGFRYHHLVWHIFINLGAISHFLGIVFLIR